MQGNGQTELCEALMGLLPVASGSVHLDDHDITDATPRARLSAGIGYIPEDRQEDGLVSSFPVSENIVLDTYNRPPFASGLALKLGEIRAVAEKRVSEFDIRTQSIDAPVGTLSGGNQQKVILAREVGREVRLLLASQPTRGLDVGSIEFVHRRIIEERDNGVAVVLVSSELDEIYALADQIAIMYEGRFTGFRPPDVPVEELGLLMAGVGGDGAAGGADAERAATDAGGPPDAAGPPDARGRPMRRGLRDSRGRSEPPGRAYRTGDRRADPAAPGDGDDPTVTSGNHMSESAPAPATPSSPAPAAETAPERPPFGRAILDAIIEGNSVVVTILAIVTAIVLGGLLIAFTNTTVLHAWGNLFSAPGNAIAQAWDAASGAYVAIFEGAIFNPHTLSALFHQKSMSIALHDGALSAVFNPLSETAVNATPLIMAGLSVAVAFRAGLFNIGAQSQFIGGAILATWLGFGVSMPPVIHVIVCVLGAFAGGAALGWLVGLLKARTGAHEVIVTIMLNYVMVYLLSYLLSKPSLLEKPGANGNLISPNIASNAHLPLLAGTHLRINAGFLLALACAAGVWWLMSRSTLGFEFRTVGANPNAARSAGMSVPRTWILVMLIAGGLGGLAASTVIQGTDFSLNFQSYGTYGIDAITVALLGRARPGGVVLAALLFGALHAGAPLMQTSTGVPVDIVQVIEALIVMFVAAPPLIRALYRLRAARAGGTGQVLSKGWNA